MSEPTSRAAATEEFIEGQRCVQFRELYSRGHLRRTRGRLHPPPFIRVLTQVESAAQEAPEAPRRNREPPRRLAAIPPAHPYRGADGGGRDLVQRRGERNRAVLGGPGVPGRQELVRAQLATGR